MPAPRWFWARVLNSEGLQPPPSLAFSVGVAILATSRPLEGFIFACCGGSSALAVGPQARGRSNNKYEADSLCSCFHPCYVTGLVAYDNLRVTGARFYLRSLSNPENTSPAGFLMGDASPPLPLCQSAIECLPRVLPALYQTGWNGAIKNVRDNALMFWYFFVGPAFSIPLLMLPWLFRDRDMRLPLLPFGLSSLVLLSALWFHPHYVRPAAGHYIALVVQAFGICASGVPRPAGWSRFGAICRSLYFLRGSAAFLISRWPALFRFWLPPLSSFLCCPFCWLLWFWVEIAAQPRWRRRGISSGYSCLFSCLFGRFVSGRKSIIPLISIRYD